MISASPWPPPPHSAAAPTPPPRRWSSRARCSTTRAPDMPTGCPSAIAPPLTLTSVLLDAELAGRLDADGGERLVELEEVDVGGRDALLLRRLRDRVGGLELERGVGAGHLAGAPISASQVRPSSSALALLITTTAQAPSEICEAEPAVMVPSLATGRRPARDSTVVSPRMPSSSDHDDVALAGGIVTGTTSSSKTPFFQARAAPLVGLGSEGVLLLAGQVGAGGVAALGQVDPSPGG